jgi:hypothetical protein
VTTPNPQSAAPANNEVLQKRPARFSQASGWSPPIWVVHAPTFNLDSKDTDMKFPFLIASTTVLTFIACSAIAGPSCDKPKDQWMKEADFKTQLEKQGYDIKTFKVSKGQCYEIYGYDKSGKKVEIYFDPVTAAILEQK